MNPKIQAKEQIGRVKLTTAYPQIKWSFMTEESETHDAEALINGRHIVAEIKCREIGHYRYPDSIIEEYKLHQLQQHHDSTQVYIVHFNNNITATWNLSKIKWDVIKYEHIPMPYNSTLNQNVIYKKVYKLPMLLADLRVTDSGLKYQN